MSEKTGQGTASGVVIPCMANILGVLLFLRLPWIVGIGGVTLTFIAVFLCCLTTLITALSLSAIATNVKMFRSGGSYFLLGRSLGAAPASGIGFCFFIANAIGAAMYMIGTVEAWETAVGPNGQIAEPGTLNNIRIMGIVILVVSLGIVLVGVKSISKAVGLFLGIVLLVILFMLIGTINGGGVGDSNPDLSNLEDNPDLQTPLLISTVLNSTWVENEGLTGFSFKQLAENSGSDFNAINTQTAFPKSRGSGFHFFTIIAIWFPACTGIMAGSNRSGELADPKKSIPIGTLIAQFITSIIYLLFVLLNGGSADRLLLLNDPFYAATSAWPTRSVVVYGVMASSFGAGLQSLISASRLLSAISSDLLLSPLLDTFVYPSFKGYLSPMSKCVLFSGFICLIAILIGEINVIAPVITICFLLCYLGVNFSTFMLHILRSPNWRPTFVYYHWSASLFGVLLCSFLMFAISYIATLIVLFMAFGIYIYAIHSDVYGTTRSESMTDVFEGLRYLMARACLNWINTDVIRSQNWRPHLLVLSGMDVSFSTGSLSIVDLDLVRLGSHLKYGRGLFFFGGVVDVPDMGEGSILSQIPSVFLSDWNFILCENLKNLGIKSAFSQLLFGRDRLTSIQSLLQTTGLGALEPNCVFVSWPKLWLASRDTRIRFMGFMQSCSVFEKSVVIAKYPTDILEYSNDDSVIDVWWHVGDGGWTVLFAYLLRKHPVWENHKIRLFSICQSWDVSAQKSQDNLMLWLKCHRLENMIHEVFVISRSHVDTLYYNKEEDNFPTYRNTKTTSILKRENSTFIGFDNTTSNNFHQHRKRSSSVASLSGLSDNGGDDWMQNDDNLAHPTMSHSLHLTRLFRTSKDKNLLITQPHLPRLIKQKNNWNMLIDDEIPETRRHNHSSSVIHNMINSEQAARPSQLELMKKLNNVIMKYSGSSNLIITNLFEVPNNTSAVGWFQMVEYMTANINRFLLVRVNEPDFILSKYI